MTKFLVKPSDVPVTPRRKSSNKRIISGAQVLTSTEILSLLKEKEEKKRKEAEDKERKKKEREAHKKLREEEAKRKSEEKKKREEEKSKKAAEARAVRASRTSKAGKRSIRDSFLLCKEGLCKV